MDTFDRWFNRFLWGTDIVFLAASTPHIAAWYAHFDKSGDWLATSYAWLVGYGLALAIDGVSIMLLFAFIRLVRSGEKGAGAKVGIITFMAAIAGLSWFINWQYDLAYASTAFAKADVTTLPRASITIGTLNPIIGGAFSLLMLSYALIGRVMKAEAVPVMTDEQFEAEKRRVARQQELRELRRGKGFIARARDAAIEGKAAWQELRETTNTTGNTTHDTSEHELFGNQAVMDSNQAEIRADNVPAAPGHPKKELIEAALRKAMASGEKINQKALAQELGVGYSTLRDYYKALKQERTTDGMPTLHVVNK